MKLVLVLLLVFATVASGQTPDPSTFILTTTPPVQIEVVGAFRLPRETRPAQTFANAYPVEYVNQDSFEFNGNLVGYDPLTKTLIASTRRHRVIAVKPPSALVKSDNIKDLPWATWAGSRFISPSNNNWDICEAGASCVSALGGGLLTGSQFVFSGFVGFDAGNVTRRAFRMATWPLVEGVNPPVPWRTVGTTYTDGDVIVTADHQQGMIGGYFIPIPLEHQAALKGTVCTGLQAVSIQHRTSGGPVCAAWTPSALLSGDAPATRLVGYPLSHMTLGSWEAGNAFYGISTAITGGFFTKNYLVFLGTHGYGPNCYGTGTATKSLAGQAVGDGSIYCYDPTNGYKATHSYPYRFQAWAYKVSDLAAVARGEKQPWDLIPVSWAITLPYMTEASTYRLGQPVVDENGDVFVPQMFSDVDGYNSRATIIKLRVTETGAMPTDPIQTPDPVAILQAEVTKLTAELALAKSNLALATGERDALQATVNTFRSNLLALQVTANKYKTTPKSVKTAIANLLVLYPQ